MSKGIKKTYKIGQENEKGWKYCGISPDTGKPLFAAPEDDLMTWYDTQEKKNALKHNGKTGRLPSPGELSMMFENRASLKLEGSGYWTNKFCADEEGNPLYGVAHSHNFNVGMKDTCAMKNFLSVRFVYS